MKNVKGSIIIILLVVLLGVIIIGRSQQRGMDSALIKNHLQAEEIIGFDWIEFENDFDWNAVDDFNSKPFIAKQNQERYMYKDSESNYYLLVIDKTKAKSKLPYYVITIYTGLIEHDGVVTKSDNTEIHEYKVTQEGYTYLTEKLN